MDILAPQERWKYVQVEDLPFLEPQNVQYVLPGKAVRKAQ